MINDRPNYPILQSVPLIYLIMYNILESYNPHNEIKHANNKQTNTPKTNTGTHQQK